MDLKSGPALFGAFGTFGLVAALFLSALSPKDAPPAPPPPAVEETGPAESGTGETEASCARWCEPLRLFDEFFALRLPSGTETAPVAADRIATRAADLGYTVDALIVLIPDPLDSGLSYRSNEALEALQSAFADSGYRFDRQWLPWEGKAAEEKRHRREPGVLLFRHPARDGRPLLTAAFLVGETPKGGVHKAALFEALDLIAELRGPEAAPPGPTRILGPTFSGSAESLAIALRRWLVSSRRSGTFQLVTGTATDPTLEQTFERYLPKRLLLERGIVADDVLERQTLDVLVRELGWNPDDVALLSESDTAYGQGLRNRVSQSRRGFLYVEFPSRLARIRTAREREGLRQKEAEAGQLADPARRHLDLSLAGEERAIDSLPQIGNLAESGNDLVLSNLLSTLAREKTRYVGIRATDLRDRLFLVEQIRSYLPDVVVFTFDNHLLDAHPGQNRSMEGALVLTGFPLYIAKHEGAGWRYRRQPVSELQQGIRLAARRLLMDEPLEPPRSWIVAVGNGRLWPLASAGAGGGAPLPIAGADVLRRTSKGPLTAVLVIVLAVWLLSRAVPFQKAALSPAGDPAWRQGAVSVPLLGMVALALAAGTLTVLFALPLFGRLPRLDAGGTFWSLLPGLLFLTAVYGAAVWLCAWLATAGAAPRRRLLWGAVWAVAALLLLVLLGWALRALWVIPEGAEFFLARVWTPASGLSPWPPLLLLLAAVWAWSLAELKRRQLTLLQEIPWPLVNPPEPSLAAGETQAERLRSTLNRRLPGPVFWIVLGIAFLIPLPRLLQGVQPITEAAFYGWIFVALVGFVFTLSAVSFWRFFATWRLLERLLDRLCQSWLLPVFHAGAPEYDWQPMKSFGLRMPPFKMSLISVERLKVIARLGLFGPDGAALTGRPGVEKGVLDASLDRIYRADRDGAFLAEVEARCELRDWLSRGAHSLELWRTASGGAEPPDTDLEGAVQPRPRELELREIERYLGIRVVAWLRYVFAHLRASLLGALASGLLLLVAVSEYAFQPKRYLSFGIWAALLLGALLTLRAFVQMDRNAALSSIGRTDAGKVSFDRTFFSNLFTYVGVPVLGVVLTQFPAVGHLVGDWLQPLLRLLTGS